MALSLLRVPIGLTAAGKKCLEQQTRVVLFGIIQRHGFSSSKPASRLDEAAITEETITPVFQVATQHINKVALKDRNGTHTYGEILRKSLLLAAKIRQKIGPGKSGERIVFLCPNDVTYLLAQWACWASGHIGKFVFICFIYRNSSFRYYTLFSAANPFTFDCLEISA